MLLHQHTLSKHQHSLQGIETAQKLCVQLEFLSKIIPSRGVKSQAKIFAMSNNNSNSNSANIPQAVSVSMSISFSLSLCLCVRAWLTIYVQETDIKAERTTWKWI